MTANAKKATRAPAKPKKEVAVVVPQASPLLNQPVQETNMLAAIARAVSDPTLDVEKMERMLAMHERLVAAQAEKEFGQAMTRLQPQLPIIKKNKKIVFVDKKGNEQNTPYAGLEDIEKAIRPYYTAEGFSTSYDSEYIDGKIGTVLIVRHTGGHVERYRVPPLPLDTSGSKNNIQAAGSTMTYGERYAIKRAFNVITEGLDTDGLLLDQDGNPIEKGDKFTDKAQAEAKAHKDAATPASEEELRVAATALRRQLKAAKDKEARDVIVASNLKLMRALDKKGLKDIVKRLHEIIDGTNTGDNNE